MAAYPSYTIVGLLSPEFANYPVTAPAAGGQNPDTTTAISADASDQIKALLIKFFPAGVTITQA